MGSLQRFAAIAVLCLLCQPATGFVRPVLPVGQAGSDLTAAYQRYMDQQRRGIEQPLPADLQNTEVIFVPGFLSDLTQAFFRSQEDWLTQEGVTVTRLGRGVAGFSGENLPVRNALSVMTVIKNSPKDVILVSHSKGSLETLMALLYFPEIRSKVKGWISLQGLVFGSPVADEALQSRWFPVWKKYLGRAIGHPETIAEMSVERRTQYIRTQLPKVQELVTEINVLSFATWDYYFAMDPIIFPVMVAFGSDMNRQFRSAHDGLIPVPYAMVPGSDFIVGAEIDHLELALDRKSHVSNQVALRALIDILLR